MYDGKNQIKSREDQIKIVNKYARSKLMGEAKLILKIFNTKNKFFGHYKKKRSSSLIQNSFKKKIKIKIFKNIYFSPLHISSLVNLLIRLCYKKIPGIYNLGSKGGISKKLLLNEKELKKIKLNY